MIEQADFAHPEKGVGIFVAPGFSRLVYFPFVVKERMVLDNTFDVRDVLMSLGHIKVYHALLLSKGNTRLFSGEVERVKEIVNSDFPATYTEEYQLQHASPGGTTVKEESQVDQARMDGFLRKIDHLLGKHAAEGPIVLFGVDEHLNAFKRVSSQAARVVGEVPGNADYLSADEVGKRAWLVMEILRSEKQQEIPQLIDDARSGRRFVSGIQEVWDAVLEGRGHKLFLEYDFSLKAYKDMKTHALVIEGEGDDNLQEIPDAVEQLISEALAKGTEVLPVENNYLLEYGHVALITRY